MSRLSKLDPPRPCPICRVAMQATATGHSVTHRCERCGTVIAVAKPQSAGANSNS